MKIPKGQHRFGVYSNWCDYDCLGPMELVDGDEVIIRWPDGTVGVHSVKVIESSYQMYDHGSPCTIPTKKAFITIKHNGADISVRVTDLHVKGVWLKAPGADKREERKV